MEKILVVDDAQSVRLELKTALSQAGFEVFEADCCAAAMKVVSKTPDIGFFFLDFNMPDENGLETLERMRQVDGYQKTPCVMLTTESSSDWRTKAKELGVDVWIMKPFESTLVINMVRKILARK